MNQKRINSYTQKEKGYCLKLQQINTHKKEKEKKKPLLHELREISKGQQKGQNKIFKRKGRNLCN